jgi:hypothetical protein
LEDDYSFDHGEIPWNNNEKDDNSSDVLVKIPGIDPLSPLHIACLLA